MRQTALPVEAVGSVGRGCLAPVLLAYCFLVLDSVLAYFAVQQNGLQEAGDIGKADLILEQLTGLMITLLSPKEADSDTVIQSDRLPSRTAKSRVPPPSSSAPSPSPRVW